MPADDQPLAAPDTERALLAAILDAPETAPELTDQLQPNDFYEPKHGTIWQAIQHIVQTDLKPDIATLTDRLRRDRNIPALTYLPDLAGQGSWTQAGHYITIIRDYAARRRLHTIGTRLHQAAQNGQSPYDAAGIGMDALEAELRAQTPTHHETGRRDLTWILTGQPPVIPPPAYVPRDDGTHLFYAAKTNGIFGDPDTAKTWLVMGAAVQELAAGGRAAHIDVDHNGQQLTTHRMLLLGATPHQLGDPDHYRYYEPEDATELRHAIHEITDWRTGVTILDSLGEIIPMLGYKSADNDEVTTALRTIVNPPAAAGSCVITIDHLPKGEEARKGGFAIGGGAKKRAINGSYIHAEVRTTPAPGSIGRINLYVEKDRPGELRRNCNGKYIGTYTIDSTDPNITKTTIQVATVPKTADGALRPTERMEQVSRYLEQEDDARSQNQIVKALKGRSNLTIEAIERLIEEGYVATFPGRHNATQHKLIAMYREDTEDET